MKGKGSVLIILIGIIAVVLLFIRLNHRIKDGIKNAEAVELAKQDPIPEYKPPVDTFPYLYKPYDIIAATEHSRIFLLNGSKADKNTKNKRLVEADGDMVFVIGKKDIPFIVHTRILELKVLEPAVFRVEAYRKDNGEKVDVLEGVVRAAKRYKSQFPEPDTVRNGEMVMINDQIDLMEKEKEDLSVFEQWWKSLQ